MEQTGFPLETDPGTAAHRKKTQHPGNEGQENQRLRSDPKGILPPVLDGGTENEDPLRGHEGQSCHMGE